MGRLRSRSSSSLGVCSAPVDPSPVVHDVKPMRTLAPMFPALLGYQTFVFPNAPSGFCVRPFGADPVYPPGFSPDEDAVWPTPKFSDLNSSPMDSNISPPQPPTSSSKQPKRPVGRPRKHRDGDSESYGLPSSKMAKKRGRPRKIQLNLPASTAIVADDISNLLPPQLPSTSLKQPKQPVGRPRKDRDIKGDSYSLPSLKMAKKRGRPRKIQLNSLASTAVITDDMEDGRTPRECVCSVLTSCDALLRRLVQLEEANELKGSQIMSAWSIMVHHGLGVNKARRMGPVPGVEVGDIFYYRTEACLVGLHSQAVAGIDYIKTLGGGNDGPRTLSIVAASVYDNKEEDVGTLVYNGEASAASGDQELRQGNLALETSLQKGDPVRVLRAVADAMGLSGKIYVYDGLYKLKGSCLEKTPPASFNVFQYKLVREPGQPDGVALWRKAEQWRSNPATRENLIIPDLSAGIETLPVCVVNEVDEGRPAEFTYTIKVRPSTSETDPLPACRCASMCLPGDSSCSCASRNGGNLPYNAAGVLVCRKPMLFECGDSCSCSVTCRNRVAQRGSQLHFEVFRTADRGWGLRSWDPIRNGTFICEFTGVVIIRDPSTERKSDEEEDDYVFRARHLYQPLKWNYSRELLGEAGTDHETPPSLLPQVTVDATSIGNVSRFMNHSCEPNVFWQPAMYDHADDRQPHVLFFAARHIPPMTELTYDYGIYREAAAATGHGKKRCFCGTPTCRGFFG